METTQQETDYIRPGLLDSVFSWSLKDIFNKNLYKDKVKNIPTTFESTTDYMNSFVFPLLEETKTDLFSQIQNVHRAPYCIISNIKTSMHFKPPQDLYYKIGTRKVNDFYDRCTGKYEPDSGDLFAITNVKPRRIEDINKPGIGYVLAFVHKITDEKDNMAVIQTSKL